MVKVITAPRHSLNASLENYLKPDEFAKQLLYNRGIRDEDEIRRFLHPTTANMRDPFEMDGVAAAVERIMDAIQRKQRIMVFGDFDADGITGAAIMVQTARALGGAAKAYIPDRLLEGHGLSKAALAKLIDKGAELLITVDTGISSADEILYAAERGVETIITDHHSVVGNLPLAAAIVHDTRFSGAGLAFKLASALFEKAGQATPEHFWALATLGTIADKVSLLGDNRIIATKGLQAFKTTDNPGLVALMETANGGSRSMSREVDSDFIAFQIAPRINAPGRIDCAEHSLNLLNADNIDKARMLAEHLNLINKQRQKMTAEAVKAVEVQIADQKNGAALIFELEREFLGLNGLIASKLADEYGQTAVGLIVDGDNVRASIRDNSEFHIQKFLHGVSATLLQYGGHSNAGGFVAPKSKVNRILKRLNSQKGAFDGATRERELAVDCEISLEELGSKHWAFISLMKPFGENNPEPLLLARQMQIHTVDSVGKKKNHLRGEFMTADRRKYKFIGFNMSQDDLNASSIDAALKLRTNMWNGKISNEIELVEIL